MCGIIGFCVKPKASANKDLLYKLMKESKIRGLHSFGFADSESCQIMRTLPEQKYLSWFLEASAGVFHNRYCTSGDWRDPRNNQPLVSGGISLAMNGVVSMKPREEYEKEYGIKCETENDSEIFLKLLKRSSEEAISKTGGAWAAIWLIGDKVFAARNLYRPLFWFRSGPGAYLCSTADIAYRSGVDYAKPVPAGKEFCLNDAL